MTRGLALAVVAVGLSACAHATAPSEDRGVTLFVGRFTLLASRAIPGFSDLGAGAAVTGRGCREHRKYFGEGRLDDPVIERAVGDALAKAPRANTLLLAKMTFDEPDEDCVTVTGWAATR